jgi:hypothetical protein
VSTTDRTDKDGTVVTLHHDAGRAAKDALDRATRAAAVDLDADDNLSDRLDRFRRCGRLADLNAALRANFTHTRLTSSEAIELVDHVMDSMASSLDALARHADPDEIEAYLDEIDCAVAYLEVVEPAFERMRALDRRRSALLGAGRRAAAAAREERG